MLQTSIGTLAEQLEQAWQTRQALQPASETGSVTSTDEAYEVSSRWLDLRLAAGDKVVGRKIGLTSKAMQDYLGVSEPDYGTVLASRWYEAPGGVGDVPTDVFLQPRVEAEIAFLMGRRLVGPGVTLQDVLLATDALAVSVEIVDSRFEDWRIKIVDTVADNASFGGFLIGDWNRSLREVDLRQIGIAMYLNGMNVAAATGAAALGHPARAVAWLANKLGEFDVALEAGDIVLSGSLGAARPVVAGDVCTVQLGELPPLRVRFV